MKNIHLLLTGESYLSLNCSYRDSAIGTQVGKPYWTYSKEWKHHMSVTDASVRPHNIYITNDEEIKDGDYYLYLKDNSVQQFIKKHHTKLLALDIQKKIILTTDQDLIKDGVQAIDDKFLEWFVKNPSCEWVKVTEHLDAGFSYGYKIIIPKEEPKLQCKDCNDNLTDCTCIEDTVDMKQWPESTGDIFSDYAVGESKAIQNSMHLDAEIACRSMYKPETTADYIDRHIVEAMVEVAKQNLYSKEDMKSSFQVGFNVGYNDEESPSYLTFEEWIKKYKKK